LERFARLAPHPVLDPADRALMHAVDRGEIHPPLTSRQSQTDLPNLSIQNLRKRVVISPQTSPVPQAINRVAGVITEIEILRPVVGLVIVTVADELVAAELP